MLSTSVDLLWSARGPRLSNLQVCGLMMTFINWGTKWSKFLETSFFHVNDIIHTRVVVETLALDGSPMSVDIPLLPSPQQIIFLGKVADELFVKVVEMKRIQGNAHVGSMKCQTRELFSFYPLVCGMVTQ